MPFALYNTNGRIRILPIYVMKRVEGQSAQILASDFITALSPRKLRQPSIN
jgi:hypothetical protein